MSRKLFVTTALPYANGPFHIGHIMEYIQADIWVRFQRMQGHTVHFVGADDAHGAPIMIAAEKAGLTPAGVRRRHRRRAQAVPGRLPHLVRQLAFHRFAGEHRAVAGHIPQAQGRRPDRHQDHRAVLRSGQGHVPAGPLHQGRVPGMPLQGPVRRRLRSVQLGVCADRTDQPLFHPVRRSSGDEKLRALFFPAVGPAVRRLPEGTGPATNACSRWSPTRHANGWRARTAWATGTSRATRPTSASRSRTRRANSSTSGWTRRWATWRA